MIPHNHISPTNPQYAFSRPAVQMLLIGNYEYFCWKGKKRGVQNIEDVCIKQLYGSRIKFIYQRCLEAALMRASPRTLSITSSWASHTMFIMSTHIIEYYSVPTTHAPSAIKKRKRKEKLDREY
ncbi:hypothetical protein NC651_000838 [Populus alba x Populus x berolinensis]|nr:hypothetical protein NC651_000838 [Populus alba x Populus x berolinensis]